MLIFFLTLKLYYDIIAYRYKEESNYNQKLLDYRKRLADALFSVKNSKEQPNKKIDYNKNNGNLNYGK